MGISRVPYRKVLLTGGSGTLGRAIRRSARLANLEAPSSDVLDIRDLDLVEEYLAGSDVDVVLHAAAFARVQGCEENPSRAIQTNIVGTSNLVRSILRCREAGRDIRLVHVSTDGVYEGLRGDYSEEDTTNPTTTYGWSKLGAECSVRVLSNYCIIRTRFFDPAAVAFAESATDIFTSRIPVDELAAAIALLLYSDFTGTVNVGGARVSDFNCYLRYKPDLAPTTRSELAKTVRFALPNDASMNVGKWKGLADRLSRPSGD